MIIGKPTPEQMEKVKILLGEILYNQYKYERMEAGRTLREKQGEDAEPPRKMSR